MLTIWHYVIYCGYNVTMGEGELWEHPEKRSKQKLKY